MTLGRVVHVVCSDSFAGVERYIADTAGELSSCGWDVTVVGGDQAMMRRNLPAGVDCRSGHSLAQVSTALWDLGRFDVVHAHMTAAELPTALLKRRLDGRLIVTRHFAARRGKSRPGALAGKVIARRLDTQISVSQFVADSIGEPSLVVHNGVRASTLTPGTRSQTVVVLQRLEREKDTATALRAWAASNLAGCGWRMVIYGRGTECGALQSLTRKLAIEGSVEFGGFVEDPRKVLSHAEILLATAPAEPFGLTVVEAMAEGVAVLAADGGAHRETLGPHGRLFAARDANACAEHLTRLAGSAELRETIGARLRERQALEFSLGRHVTRLQQVYGR